MQCRAESLAAAYYLFQRKGYQISIASVTGGKVPFDPVSLSGQNLTIGVRKLLSDSKPSRGCDMLPASCCLAAEAVQAAVQHPTDDAAIGEAPKVAAGADKACRPTAAAVAGASLSLCTCRLSMS